VRRAIGISGAYWVYAAFTTTALIVTYLILSKRTVHRAIAEAKAASGKAPGLLTADGALAGGVAQTPGQKEPFSVVRWLRNHPLADPKFAFFIFCLIPVQTLFAHNWLTLPMYVERAYRGTWIGTNFEVATNFNPILIFILVPMVAALTQKRNVYNMMIAGTMVMAAPTFLLAIKPTPVTLLGYLVIMTFGEAMWQPRFLQYAAEIAPEGRTGAYMGVAQFPWFLTKMITSLYSGWFLQKYCPQQGALHTETMWLIYGSIAICSSILLLLAKGWIGKDFKTKAG
jgi:POT family proton-dependent oligopeptide transporter